MKKLLLLVSLVFLFTGCEKEETAGTETEKIQVVKDTLTVEYTDTYTDKGYTIYDFEYHFSGDDAEKYSAAISGQVYATETDGKMNIKEVKVKSMMSDNPQWILDGSCITDIHPTAYGDRAYIGVSGVFENRQDITETLVDEALPGMFLEMMNVTWTTTWYDRKELIYSAFYISQNDLKNAQK